jgi:hypothetical protein
MLRHGYLFIGLLLLAAVASGCLSSRAQSDLDWKQYNPTYKSPLPDDGRPQWGPFAPP